jgi:serine/threonine protein kinase
MAEDRGTGARVAVKIEPPSNRKQVLKMEATILQRLQRASSPLPPAPSDGTPARSPVSLFAAVEPSVGRYIASGRFRSCHYLVMELLGQNLSDVRRARPDGVFSVGTTARLGLDMLAAIEGVHRLGYLHRDIKPVRVCMWGA